MSVDTTRRPKLIHFDFRSLYLRHLGRHSQMGINMAHLVALFGLWFGIYAAIGQGAHALGLQSSWPILLTMALSYLATIAINAPPAVILATAGFLALLVVSVLALPALPWWSFAAFLTLIPVCYKLQAWSHRIWTVAEDMSRHNRRFPPGRDLNLVLLFFEIPICLNYLLFCPKDWRR